MKVDRVRGNWTSGRFMKPATRCQKHEGVFVPSYESHIILNPSTFVFGVAFENDEYFYRLTSGILPYYGQSLVALARKYVVSQDEFFNSNAVLMDPHTDTCCTYLQQQ